MPTCSPSNLNLVSHAGPITTEPPKIPTLPLLPPEILAQIFALTTTLDSGVSIRSLLLVSQLFHDICVPLKFRCLSLTTASSIERLHQELEHLENSPAHLRKILHLYISLTQSDIQTHTECDTISQIFCILHSASETLQTLTIIYHNTLFSTSVLGRLFRNSLPVLTELTIHGLYPFPGRMPLTNSKLPTSMPSLEMDKSFMPMLERLHLSGNRNPYGLLQLSSLDESFPSLSHLRISGLLMAGSFVREMKAALEEYTVCGGNPESYCDSLTYPPAKLPSKLQSVVLQPGYMPPPNRPGVAYAAKKDTWMMAQLKDIEVDAKRRQNVRVTLKNRMQDPDKVSVSSVLLSDWRGRMNGDEGCWRSVV
ncbi:hypothetical protein J3R30DRAFT_2752983 [Lentinula aciculospora]|uniref:F-box domain-containing protein n=1 Tax=Lentinula aciculospora TaxID=153920 RepID=A0A9W9DNN8_9AGAR|nr:hypothetical protein J3R30DRAFT_2752983 [Lentinula aciculospora]